MLRIETKMLRVLAGIERMTNSDFYVEGEDGRFYRPKNGWIDYAYT